MCRLVGAEPAGDDVAVLAARRVESSMAVPLNMVIPAVPRSLAEVRFSLRRWLRSVGASHDDLADVLVAVGEACSNVVEHAYGPGGGRLVVHAEHDQPEVIVDVRDNGRWRAPRGENRGRGTTLMRQCSDDVEITTGPGGTTVRIRRRLARDEA